MIYGVILAGGIGSRMGNDKLPKQYMNIGGKPIIIHTIEKFFLYDKFEKILVLCPAQWVEHTRSLIEKYMGETPLIQVIEGGSARNETIYRGIEYIEKENNLNDNTIIVTHDAVRPFITNRIIKDNVAAALEFGACDTVIPATDTIVESINGEDISEIPDRANLYQGQTPQSFRAKELKDLYNNLSEEEKEQLTDAAKIFTLNGKSVKLVEGETFNIKITHPYDIAVAEALLHGGIKC